MMETDGSIDDSVADAAAEVFDRVRAGDTSILALVDAGVPVTLRTQAGDSLLMLAAYHGHADLVRGLLERGADSNLENDRGQTPLAGAVFKGYDDVMSVLIAAGADLDLGTPSARAAAQMFGRTLPEGS